VLVATRCEDCGTSVFGTHRACLACASPRVRRISLTSRGTLLSWSVVHRPAKDWWGSVPYVVAEAETDDGVVVVAGMVDLADVQVEAGMRVELRTVLLDHPTADARVAVYQWRPLADQPDGG